MALPNILEQVKVFPNEYIDNVTLNRPFGRLYTNDEYLYNLIMTSGSVILDIQTDINSLCASVISLSSDIDNLSFYLDTLSAITLVDPPSAISAPGEYGQVAIANGYVYFYAPTGGIDNWPRIALDYTAY